MEDKNTHPPSTEKTAFDCPHCGAYTTQHWYKLHAAPVDEERRIPLIVDEETIERIKNTSELKHEVKDSFLKSARRAITGFVYIESQKETEYLNNYLQNLNISRCYNCKKISVWRHTSLIYPVKKLGPVPNRDLPESIQADFEEARCIIDQSPRGAAALLRLCIQKLCAHLGESGKDLDKDIASLVAKGLNPMVQKSLDVVRVIGNEAVHPGVIDLTDNKGIALKLLDLVNIIAEQMISQPQKIEELYKGLPDAKRKYIEERNRKSRKT